MAEFRTDHNCHHEGDIAKLTVGLENVQTLLERGEKRFDRHEDILEQLKIANEDRKAFEQKFEGGYKLFLFVLTLLGSIATIMSVKDFFTHK